MAQPAGGEYPAGGDLFDRLTRTGHDRLLWYALQQIEQFRKMGREFAMQHADTEYMGDLEEELQTAVLETIPVEKRLRGLPPEERLRGLPPEERLRGLSPEEVLKRFTPEEVADGLTDAQADQLRDLLDRRRKR